MSASSVFQGLPQWAQGVLSVAGLATSVLIGYGVYRVIKKRIATQKDRDVAKSIDSEIEDLKKEGMRPTITQAQARTMAQTLAAAFEGYGTKNADVKRVFGQLKNELDLRGLIKEYGIRTISSGRYNPEPNFTGGLAGALSSEMSGNEIAAINQILSKGGIKFQF